eukprot:scaffold73441_cov54-Phaeocystis_antarctica.AAC.1
MLHRRAVHGDVIAVNAQAVIARPQVVSDDVRAVDLDHRGRLHRADVWPTNPGEDVGEDAWVGSVSGVAPHPPLQQRGGWLRASLQQHARHTHAVHVGDGDGGQAIGGDKCGEAKAEQHLPRSELGVDGRGAVDGGGGVDLSEAVDRVGGGGGGGSGPAGSAARYPERGHP